MTTSKLVAWIEPRRSGEFSGKFVSEETAAHRAPASCSCASRDEAKQWVEREANALGVSVEWTDRPPPFG